MKFFRSVLAAAAVLALVGCGGATATPNVSTPNPINVAGAQRAALALFVEDPTYSGHWGSCEGAGSTDWGGCPLTAKVEARLDDLRSKGYFGDTPPLGVCGEDYITGTQNGFYDAPLVMSAVAGPTGIVTVVMQRAIGRADLTAVMNDINGTWLASDLASGTGPSASIFSAQPSC